MFRTNKSLESERLGNSSSAFQIHELSRCSMQIKIKSHDPFCSIIWTTFSKAVLNPCCGFGSSVMSTNVIFYSKDSIFRKTSPTVINIPIFTVFIASKWKKIMIGQKIVACSLSTGTRVLVTETELNCVRMLKKGWNNTELYFLHNTQWLNRSHAIGIFVPLILQTNIHDFLCQFTCHTEISRHWG